MKDRGKRYKNATWKNRSLLITAGVALAAVVVLVGYFALKDVLVPIPTTPVSSGAESSNTESSGVENSSAGGETSEESSAPPVSSKEESEAPSSQSSSQAPSSSSQEESSSGGSASGDYQSKYPDLYVKKPAYKPHDSSDKVVYLTFDDGPYKNTTELLDILDRYNVKATFFVVGRSGSCGVQAHPDMLREIVKRGHAIGIHTYTHDFHQVYKSVEAYLDDFKKIRDSIVEITGQEPTMFRFPGGSINGFNKKNAKQIIDEMTRRGYVYYDWNVSSGDAAGGTQTTQEIINNTIKGVGSKSKAIVLCHNTPAKKTTTAAMPTIIETLKKKGYRFDTLDPTVEPLNFPIPK